MQRLSWSFFIALLIGLTIASLNQWPLRFLNSPRKSSTTVLRGEDIIGTTMINFDEQGRPLTLKIENVEPDPQDTAQDIYLYTVAYQNPLDGQWNNLCQADTEGLSKAIPLSGRWDSTGSHIDDGSITFACTNGALGKCVRWGYKPWKTHNGQSLRNYHQACTRMVRADYCGQGIGHTKDGTSIDVYDRLGIQQRTDNSGMVFEAAWTPKGAIYLNRTRFPETLPELSAECPATLDKIRHRQESGPIADPLSSIPNALLFNDSSK